jgi:transcriptional regulator with XRE-family HTH domain
MKSAFDIDSFYGVLESKKAREGLSWRKLAQELELTDHTVFTRMSRGRVPDMGTLLRLSQWVGTPLETFDRSGREDDPDKPETLSAIYGYLRADKALSHESAEAINAVLVAAYEELVERESADDEPGVVAS